MSIAPWVRLALLLVLQTAYAYSAEPPGCHAAQAPERCVLEQQGIASCVDLKDGPRHACELEFTPALLCRGRDAAQCHALLAAQQHCTSEQGAARRACVRAQLPPERCGQSPRQLSCHFYFNLD